MNLMTQKRVDLVLHGHEHAYQRGKQLALDPTTCPSIAATGYNPGCVADDGIDGIYPKGAGTIDMTVGTFGRGLYTVRRTDPEGPYFSALDGTSHGFMQYTVTEGQLDATFVRSDGAFTDGFTIATGAAPSADRVAPSQPTNLAADTSVPGKVTLTWNPSTDDVALGSYAVFRDGVYVASTTAPTFSDPSVTSGQTYAYTVSAYDTAFNPSVMSSPVTATAAATTTLTFAPEADASIYSGSPAQNYGSSSKLETDNSPIKHFLIRFTVSGVGAAQVTNAKLRLSCVDPSPKGGDVSLAATTPWTESTVTWNTAPAAGRHRLIARLGGRREHVSVRPVLGDPRGRHLHAARDVDGCRRRGLRLSRGRDQLTAAAGPDRRALSRLPVPLRDRASNGYRFVMPMT